MKKGFSLVELLAVIVLIAILYVLLFPATIENIRKTSLKIDEGNRELIFAQAKKYLNDNPNQYPKIDSSVYCLELQFLVDAGYLTDILYDGQKRIELDYSMMVKTEINDGYQFELVDHRFCEENILFVNYVDQSGANPPELKGAMIPVIWNEGWITADISEEWYDYNEKNWANIVLVYPQYRELYLESEVPVMINDADIMAHFVWIPRFRYKLFNAELAQLTARTIEVQFESKTVTSSTANLTGDWLTHPAFTVNQNLSGFWVGKFATTGNNYVPTVKPNQTMLINLTAKNQFEIAKLIGINDYGISVSSRMMRNLEWGSIAYLSNSQYGKNSEIWINPNENLITGCAYLTKDNGATDQCESYETANGKLTSTTGNVYGVYDMSGGAWERVLGVMLDQVGNIIASSSGFTSELTNPTFIQLVDSYEYSLNGTTYERSLLGDAMGETRSWHTNYAVMPHDVGEPWVIRGGSYAMLADAGIYSFSADTGGALERSFRIIIPIN